MEIVGREKEKEILKRLVESKKPEFAVVYGRRRVGKTYLIKQFFNNKFAFYATGVFGCSTKEELASFDFFLRQHGAPSETQSKDWFSAFQTLQSLLQEKKNPRSRQKRVIFLDEVPWMDTKRSNFKAALDLFWNGYASTQGDLLLIVCGSATSWIINNLLVGRGGFYNRVTKQIHLSPFSLGETKKLADYLGLKLSKDQLFEGYMVFGGVPFYWGLLEKGKSVAQNIQELCFEESGDLYNEYATLFSSLFSKKGKHRSVIEALYLKKSGMSRSELTKIKSIGGGDGLTRALEELEQCGFIRKYRNYRTKKNESLYQIIDPFLLFALHFLGDERLSSWINFYRKPGYYAWAGNAFETVCLNSVEAIKKSLSIAGVESSVCSYQSRKEGSAAQIDLLIVRKDSVINLCEIKYSSEPFAIDKQYEENLLRKMNSFIGEEQPKEAVKLTMIVSSSLKKNAPSSIVDAAIPGDDLFL